MDSVLLNIQQLNSCYGVIQVLHQVNVSVQQGEIVTLIGANGAGKSTLLMTVCGDPKATAGKVYFAGQDITALPTHEIIHAGIAHVPEGRRIFARMTVLENLAMGCLQPQHHKTQLAQVFDLFPRLAERQEQLGGTLSGGEQQMLAIARALMSRPRLLLLDEPSLGLAPLMVKQIFQVIEYINKQGISIFLVEQNACHALRLAHRAYVMVNGRIHLSGTGQALSQNPDIQRAYLGL